MVDKDRIEGDLIRINKKLLPLSWLYGLGVGFRNLLFEMGILKSRSFTVPVISVGNITVGGTGKTPHVEYLIRLLKDIAKVAVLSRGYKRKSHGFVLAGKETTMSDIGDEPFQMLQKFPDITVAVDKKRTRGIDKLTSGDYVDGIDVVLLGLGAPALGVGERIVEVLGAGHEVGVVPDLVAGVAAVTAIVIAILLCSFVIPCVFPSNFSRV